MEVKTNKNRSTFNLMCYVKRARALKNGELPVHLRITVNSQIAEISMQGTVPPALWNQAKEKSTGKDRAAQELNYYIESVKSRLYQLHRDMELEGKLITAQILKEAFLGNTPEEEGKTLNEAHSEHNERCRKLVGVEYSQSTIYKFDTSLKYLKEFMQTELKREDIPLKKINEDFIRNYEAFLKTEKGCQNNSAVKHLKIFKKIILIAIANDWIQRNPFVTIKFRQDEVHTEFLTIHELEILINKKLSSPRLSQIRDVFVFCCFTGLAFVDVKNLKEEHIIKSTKNEMWIRKPREKTNNMCNIPLLNIPKMLLDRYKDDRNCKARGQLLPVPTNQKMNAYLKEVAEICEINKNLTTHCARHTFATTITFFTTLLSINTLQACKN